MAKLKIGKFEVIDHGVNGSQYFQGCGVSFTEFDHVVTGYGDNFSEALEDALEMLAQYATPNGHPTIVYRDGEQYVNSAAYDDFDVEGLLERICEEYDLDQDDLPTNPSATGVMLQVNIGNAEFDEEEPNREDYASDEEYKNAVSNDQARYAKWEEEQEELKESLTQDSDSYYYVSIRWCQGIDWTKVYENGECPECQESIQDGVENGEECDCCGYVFSFENE